jgi:hypothetical protein
VDLLVGLSSLIFVVVGTAVGVRILLRARVDRSLPELAIGLALVSFAGVSQPLGIARYAFEASLGVGAIIALQLGANAASTVTVLSLYAFTWRVFRPEARWAVLLFAGGSALGVWASAAMAAVQFYDAALTPELSGSWLALSALSYGICFGWAGFESLTYWRRLRRRQAVGLAEPLLVNRFLLWGGGCSVALAVDVVLMGCALQGIDFGRHPLPRLLMATSVLVNSACWLLSFTPPAWYARWIRSRHPLAFPPNGDPAGI